MKQEDGKKQIEAINAKLDSYQDEIMDLPKEINELNYQLMLKTMDQCYEIIRDNTKEIEEICYTYLHNAYNIKVKSKSLTVETVKQFYCLVKEKDKIEVMSRLIDLNGYKLVMVFCNTKRAVDDVTSGLLQKGYIVEGLHGDMRQMQRDRVMARFREGLINILVASDVAARGLDVDDVDVVINYDVPEDDEYYIHRIGRTGRAKKQGLAISLVNTNEKFRLRSIINYTKADITKLEIPELSKVLKIRISRIIQNAIDETMNDSIETAKLKKMISKTVANEIIDKSILAEDIISGLILMQMEDTQDVDIIDETLSKSSKGDNSRLFINLGKKIRICIKLIPMFILPIQQERFLWKFR